MKAVRCRKGEVYVADVAHPASEGVRVKVVSSGICGSDLHLLSSGWPIAVTLGHETAGIAPNGVAVAIEPVGPCGHCEYCQRGAYNLCVLGATAIVYGVGRDGGMAEYITVPERCLVPLPGGLRVEDACLAEPLAVALHGIHLAGITSRDRVAVVGGGTIGLCAVAALVEITKTVHLVARHAAQRAAGERLGAHLGAAGSYDCVIDCAGSSESLAQSVGLCKAQGTVLLLSTYWSGTQLPAFEIAAKELRILAASMYCRHGAVRDIDAAVALLAQRPRIAPALITHRLPLDAAGEAFAIARDRAAGAIKVTLNP